MKSKRQFQIGAQIQRELAQVLLRSPKYPIFKQITIVDVDVSPDFAIAKVYVSLFDEANVDAALKALKDSAGSLRYALAQSLNLRKTPRLSFVYDETIKYGQRLSALIDKAVESDARQKEQNET